MRSRHVGSHQVGEQEEVEAASGGLAGGLAGGGALPRVAVRVLVHGQQRTHVLAVPPLLCGGVLAVLVRVDARAEGSDLPRRAEALQRGEAAAAEVGEVLARGLHPVVGAAVAVPVARRLEVVDHERIDAAEPRALQRVVQLRLERLAAVVEFDLHVVAADPAGGSAVDRVSIGDEVATDLGLEVERVARHAVEREAESGLAQANAVVG